jgi:hypothetical protein
VSATSTILLCHLVLTANQFHDVSRQR